MSRCLSSPWRAPRRSLRSTPWVIFVASWHLAVLTVGAQGLFSAIPWGRAIRTRLHIVILHLRVAHLTMLVRAIATVLPALPPLEGVTRTLLRFGRRSPARGCYRLGRRITASQRTRAIARRRGPRAARTLRTTRALAILILSLVLPPHLFVVPKRTPGVLLGA